ncbi:LuxR C-terminal-related transcriptional regulator [Actinoplanes sp. NPDC049681]|uniref:helix-turn-helix transcriptional regulator n=1 Tax=Actinoplanes sp. NPDC049681 TaxID=3363905 RepID=UPI003796195D
MTVGRPRVGVRAADPLIRAGLVALLRGAPQLTVTDAGDGGRPDVLVVAAGGEAGLALLLSRVTREVAAPVVLIADELSPEALLSVVRFRVRAVVPRRSVNAGALVRCVTAVAAGGGVMPPELIGCLLQHVDRLHRDLRDVAPAGTGGLTEREIEILRLIADGLDTDEIAARLSYSARTVKNIMYGVTHRLNLRNRPHAVAYAVRAGLI